MTPTSAPQSHECCAGSAPTETELDPVCGMRVDPKTAPFRHEGFVFCSAGCRDKFVVDPGLYLDAAPPAREAAAGTIYICPMDPEVRRDRPGSCPRCGMALEPEIPAPSTRTEYTCPMHPEVVRDAPGSCPQCGMALEARTVALDDENPELADMTRRFRFAAALTLPVLGLAMGHMLPGNPMAEWISPRHRVWLEALFATPVCLWSAWPFFVRAGRSLVARSLNMFTLIGLGVGVSYGYSLVAAFLPGIFPDAFRDSHGNVGVYFEAATVIVTLILLGQVLELRAAAAPVPPSKPCSDWRPKRRGAFARTAPTRTCPSTPSRSATDCGCGPVRKCPSTAWCWTARAPWTSPW